MIDQAWRSATNILLVRLDNLGDVLVTSPAFHAVRVALPHARLTLLASPIGAQAGRLNDDVDDVIEYRAPWMDPWGELPQDCEREQSMIATLRAGRFDAAIVFTSFRQSPLPAAYLCYLANIPLRLAASVDGPGSLLTTRHRHPDRTMHEVERGLNLLSAIGIEPAELDLVLRVPSREREDIEARFGLREATQRPLIVIHPGCSMPARTYSWEQYAAVGDLLIERLDARIVLTGSVDEQELTGAVRARMQHPALDLAGTLRFAELVALIAAANVTITNNTGPMHVAAAVGTPVIALFALTNPPEQWGPWRVPHRLLFHDVPCRICYSRVCPTSHACLAQVSPQMVVEATSDLLNKLGEPADSSQPANSRATELQGVTP